MKNESNIEWAKRNKIRIPITYSYFSEGGIVIETLKDKEYKDYKKVISKNII